MAVTVYHNPRCSNRCSQSRQALQLLESRGIKPRLRRPPEAGLEILP